MNNGDSTRGVDASVNAEKDAFLCPLGEAKIGRMDLVLGGGGLRVVAAMLNLDGDTDPLDA